MGNQSSTPNHNKLSKPKTNTNSVAPAAHKSESPACSFVGPVDLSAEGRQQIKDALLSPVADDFDHHARMPKKDSAIASRSNSRSDSRSNSSSCFGNKNGSATKLAGMADSKLSSVSGASVDIAEAIKLLQQVKKNGSPEDIAALQQVLEMPEEYAEPTAESSPSHRSSPMDKSSCSSLTRRQSVIQTPGVGTRSSLVDGRRRTWNSWRSPKLEPEEEAKWRPNSRIASHLGLPVSQAFGDAAQDDPRPRVPSPSDLEYSHLGSLKPGTLVVTNGPASPAPSIRAPTRAQADDEDNTSEAESGSSPLMMKSTRRRGHARSQSAVLPGTSLSTVETIDSQEPCEGMRRVSTVKLVQCPSEPVMTESTAQPIPVLQAVDSNVNAPAPHLVCSRAKIVPSPSPVSDEDRTVSKNEGFTSDDTHYPKSEDTSMSQDAVSTQTAAKHLSPPISSPAVQKKPKNRAKQRPPPQTTDSGYSSGGSLPLDDRERQSGSPYILCSQCQHHSAQRQQTTSQDREPLQPGITKQNKERVPISPLPRPGGQVQGPRNPRALAQPTSATLQPPRPDRPRSSLHVSVNSAGASSRSSTSDGMLSPQTPRSAASSKPSFHGTSGKPQKRLHRKRPSQTEALVVQSCQPIPEGKIPDVPANVRARFERRVSSTPGMDCLAQTYPTKDHVVADELRPEPPLPGHTEFQDLVELQAPQPPKRPAHARRKSLPFFRRKSMSESREAEHESGMIAIEAGYLEHIAASVGTSPYDIVTPQLPRQSTASPAYPHRLGASVPRSKSMVNMDSKAAAEFARAHSRDLAMSNQAFPQQRRKSFHSLSAEAGEARAWKSRPKSLDIPPVPSIDMAKLSASRAGTPQPNKRHSTGAIGPSTAPRGRARPRSQTVYQQESKSSASLLKPPQPGTQWEAPPHVKRQRRKTIGESMRSLDAVTVAGTKRASVCGAIKAPIPEHAPTWGRYSGGLGYDYGGRDVGVGGSAGTRQVNSCVSVKSLHYKYQYGVDLSDVPIMVQRV